MWNSLCALFVNTRQHHRLMLTDMLKLFIVHTVTINAIWKPPWKVTFIIAMKGSKITKYISCPCLPTVVSKNELWSVRVEWWKTNGTSDWLIVRDWPVDFVVLEWTAKVWKIQGRVWILKVSLKHLSTTETDLALTLHWDWLADSDLH